MAGFAKPLHLRLFLEGIEVPVVAAQVTVHLNGPAAAAVQVVPLDEVLRLKPRTMVHLFFMEKPAQEDDITGKLEDYRLLFAGEVIGFAWIQKANMRSVVLQCLDFSSYWDAAVAAAIDYGPQGDAFTNQAALVGANASVIDNIVNFEPNKLVEWIKLPPQTPGLQTISGLAGGVIRMLEALSGIRAKHRGINDFFTIAELRCRILAQICAEENDDTAYRLLKAKVFDEWVRQGLQNLGQQVTFRQMIQLLFRYIYYDFVPNPAAKYDASIEEGSDRVTKEPVPIANLQAVVAATKQLDEIQADLSSRVRSETAARGQAEARSQQLENITESLNSKTDNSDAVQRALQKIDAALATLQEVVKDGDGVKLAAITEVGEASSILKNARDTVTVSSVKSDSTSARLRSHILRPDCWFAPPPRCNVIFPEHYTDLSYDRVFISEATRMLLMFYNTLVGQNVLLSNKILSPSIGVEAQLIVGSQANEGYRNLMTHELHTGIIARTEWVPNTAGPKDPKTDADAANQVAGAKLTWGSRISLFNFFKERFSSRQASVSGRFNPYLVCGFPALVIKRPFIVKGLTEADNRDEQSILDQIQDPETAQQLGAPSQLLGMVHSITHSVGQDGGTTAISLNYVREHMGVDDEFLGVFARTKAGVQKRVRTVLVFDNVLSQPDLLRLLVRSTPQVDPSTDDRQAITHRSTDSAPVSYQKKSFDPVSQTTVATDISRNVPRTTEETKTADSDLRVTTGRIDGLDRDVLVPVGAELKPGSKGRFTKVVGVEVIDSNITLITDGELEGQDAFGAVAIYEDVTLPGTRSVAVEEIIRPTWFSPAYRNENISEKIYEPFFGVGSIIENVTFAGVDTGVADADPAEDEDVLLTRLSNLDSEQSGATIERAVNLIGYLYGIVKNQGLDVDEFITQYIRRPIAGLTDILGSNVNFEIDGTAATPQADDPEEPFKVGFHTLSVHPDTASEGHLVGLVDDPDLQLHRINQTGDARRILEGYDVRNEKWERVMAYLEALSKGPGFRG